MVIMMMLVVSIVGMMMKRVAVMKSCIAESYFPSSCISILVICNHMIKYDGEERESNHFATDLKE